MSSTVLKLYNNDDIIPHPNSNLVNYANIDFKQLAAAILDEQERRDKEEAKQKKAARAAASEKRRTTKGANGTVDPIRDKKDIERIIQYFDSRGQHRNALLFQIGCNVGLRGEDLVQLKAGDLVGDKWRIKEQKTGKYRTAVFNAAAMQCYHELVDSIPNCTPGTFLFQSQRKGNRPVSRDAFARILSQAGHDLGLPYRLGTHSMRKTFGYHLFMDNQHSPEILAYLQRILNHRDSHTTLRYIGLDADREAELYRGLDLSSEDSNCGKETRN